MAGLAIYIYIYIYVYTYIYIHTYIYIYIYIYIYVHIYMYMVDHMHIITLLVALVIACRLTRWKKVLARLEGVTFNTRYAEYPIYVMKISAI